MQIVSAVSDRKITDKAYLNIHPAYLRKERAFRRQIGVIVQKPDDYDEWHEEIWDDENVTEIWDGARELNLDEVPFIMDMTSKQIVSRRERKSVIKNNMTHATVNL